MEDGERWALMAEALKREELRIRAARMDLIGRGQSYLDDGLPLGILLESLGISRMTWFRRLKEYRERFDPGNTFFED